MSDGGACVIYYARGPNDHLLVSRHPDYVSAARELERLEQWEYVNVPRYRRSEYRIVSAEAWRLHFCRTEQSL